MSLQRESEVFRSTGIFSSRMWALQKLYGWFNLILLIKDQSDKAKDDDSISIVNAIRIVILI